MGEGGVLKLLMVADVGGGGVKIWQKSADVINGRPLMARVQYYGLRKDKKSGGHKTIKSLKKFSTFLKVN